MKGGVGEFCYFFCDGIWDGKGGVFFLGVYCVWLIDGGLVGSLGGGCVGGNVEWGVSVWGGGVGWVCE